MTAQAWQAVISGVGIVASWVGAGLITVLRQNRIEAERRAQADARWQSVDERLTRIEAMFELRLKGG